MAATSQARKAGWSAGGEQRGEQQRRRQEGTDEAATTSSSTGMHGSHTRSAGTNLGTVAEKKLSPSAILR